MKQIVLFLLLAVCSLSVSAQAPSKKCPVCGLSIRGDYSSDAQTNPTGPNSGTRRVGRGGGWSNYARFCCSSYRIGDEPDYRYYSLGFRLVLSEL